MAFQSTRVPPEKLAEFMKLARDRYQFALELDADDRDLAEKDVKFAAALPVEGAGSTQWHEGAARARVKTHRPVLTENRLPTFTAQVVNDGRQSKPAIKISAQDNGTKETAEFYQSRIRQIEYDCNADVAYDTSREQQVTCGRAFLRVTWEYIRGTMKKQARIEPITNQFSVVFGPAVKYDCSDAEYCFVISQITKEEHERLHGKETTVAHTDFAAAGNPAVGWLGCGPNAELVQKAEYWLKEYKLRTLCSLSNGKTYWKDELPEGLEQLGIYIEEERQEQDYTVVQYIIDGADILDEAVIIGPYFGIVPVWGREWFLDGKRRTSSLIRYAKDPQRLLNLYVSNIAEQIAQMPKTPYFVPVGGVPAGSQAQYDNLANDPRQYIYYNSHDANGNLLPAPTRIQNEPPIQALVAGYNQAVDAIKAAMGIFDASLGNQSNETSGIAIGKRQHESDTANFHFHDNEARTRNHIGRILLVLIPELDKGTGKRAVRSEDGKTTMVMVGAPYKDEKTGQIITHDLTGGNYGVAVDTSQSYTSARDEAFQKLTQMATSWPALLEVGGPTILRLSDLPGGDALADLMDKTLPPGLLAPKPGADQIPPQVQQKFNAVQQQAMAMIDALTKTVHQQANEIETQAVISASRERIAEQQEITKRLIALGTLDQKDASTMLQAQIAKIEQRLAASQAQEDAQAAASQADAARTQRTQDAAAGRSHDASQADAQRAHQTQLQDSAQAHAAALQSSAQQATADQAAAQPAAPAAPADLPQAA